MATIRKARLKDLDTLVKLERELLDSQLAILKKHRPKIWKDFQTKRSAGKMYRAFVKKSIHSRNGLVLLAWDGDHSVGYAHCLLRKNIPIFKEEWMAEITDLYVRNGYRKKGIATGFRDEIFEWLKGKGIRRVVLNMFPDNDLGAKVYKRWGFEGSLLEMRADVK